MKHLSLLGLSMLLVLISLNTFSQTNIFPDSGNVGIGTTNFVSGEKLNINGTLRVGTFQNWGGGDAISVAQPGNAATMISLWQAEYAMCRLGSKAGDPNIYLTNDYSGGGLGDASYSLTITNNGKFGIGTTTPNDKFSVYNKFLINNDGVARWGGSADYGFLSWDTGRAIIGGQTNEGLALYADNSEKVRILTNGNVGIGTPDPGNYKLNVIGIIRANEVVVNTPGADFVFAPQYNLMSLPEVEKFINKNKHLPDLLPATEMKENGMNVSEMQTKLLQKVEELTLYVIEQDKRIELLERENKELK